MMNEASLTEVEKVWLNAHEEDARVAAYSWIVYRKGRGDVFIDKKSRPNIYMDGYLNGMRDAIAYAERLKEPKIE